MALEYNYTTLLATLQDWPEETDPDFIAELPEIIQMGELRLLRELGLEIFEVYDVASLSEGIAEVTKPPNMVAPRSLFLAVPDGFEGTLPGAQITRQSREFIRMYNLSAPNGTPRYYAEDTETQWIVGPKPNAAAAVNGLVIALTRRPAGLSSVAPTVKTWLSTYVPDLLMDSCLLAGERYLKNDQRWAVVKRDFDLKVSDTKAELSQLRRVQPEDHLVERDIVRPGNSDAQSQSE